MRRSVGLKVGEASQVRGGKERGEERGLEARAGKREGKGRTGHV